MAAKKSSSPFLASRFRVAALQVAALSPPEVLLTRLDTGHMRRQSSAAGFAATTILRSSTKGRRDASEGIGTLAPLASG
jgi:hypothetical protein